MGRVTGNRVRRLTHYQGHGKGFGFSQGDIRSYCMVSGRVTQSEFTSPGSLGWWIETNWRVRAENIREQLCHGAIEVIPGERRADKWLDSGNILECKTVPPLWKIVWQFQNKAKIINRLKNPKYAFTIQPSSCTPWAISQRNKYIYTRTCTGLFITT